MRAFMNRNAWRWLEWITLALVVGAVWAFLGCNYSLKPYSDPQMWYLFAKHFAREFATTNRAYGFPLVLHLAIRCVGPFWAFLVNVPILAILAIVLYRLTRYVGRQSLGGSDAWGMVAGMLSLWFLFRFDRAQFLYLANPYRDPLAFSLAIGSMHCLFRFVLEPRHRLGWAAGAAGLLALSTAARDTSVMLLAPYGLFVLVAWWRDRTIPFVKAALVGAGTFAVLFVPQAVQNMLVSGSGIVPAQAAETLVRKGSLTPGVRAAFFADTFPRTLAYFQDHYGYGALALLAVGLVRAVIRRDLVTLACFMPATVLYFLFYAGYKQVMARYLLVVDLFTLPWMAVAAAALLRGISRMAARVCREEWRALAWYTVAGAWTVALLLTAWPGKRDERCRVDDMRRFQDDMMASIPLPAAAVGNRPLAEIMRCFTDVPTVTVDYVSPLRAIGDPAYFDRLVEYRDSRPLYLVVHKDRYVEFLRRRMDLVPVRVFESSRYGLGDILHRDSFTLYRVQDWTQRISETTVTAEGPGRHVLTVDVGRLSDDPQRRAISLWFGGAPLDEHPVDDLNYYAVTVPAGTTSCVVHLESDRPVPARLAATLTPLDRFVFVLDPMIEDSGTGVHVKRFDSGFLQRPWPRVPYMTLSQAGGVTVPTLDPGPDVCYAGWAVVGLDSLHRADRGEYGVRVGGRDVHRGTLETDSPEPGGDWRQVAFMFGGADVTGLNTRVEFSLLDCEKAKANADLDTGREAALVVRQFEMARFTAAPAFVVELGQGLERWFLMDGFHQPESDPARPSRHWRWTGGKARVAVPLAGGGRPAQVIVRYLPEGRPPELSRQAPAFTWNGVPVSGVSVTNELDGVRYTDVFLEIPGDAAPVINVLGLEIPPWVPKDAGVGSDTRVLGVMLQSVRARRL